MSKPFLQTRTVIEVTFGARGNHRTFRNSGWYGPEQRMTWTKGTSSSIDLHAAGISYGGFIEFFAHIVFAQRDTIPSQRVSVRANGWNLGAICFTGPGVASLYLPAHAVRADGLLRLDLEHPDAGRRNQHGADTRILAVGFSSIRILALTTALPAFPRRQSHCRMPDVGTPEAVEWAEERTGMSARELMCGFESLGANCEFGIAQRRAGAEPLGLFRFSSSQLKSVVRGIETDFVDLGDQLDVQLRTPANGHTEWVMVEPGFGMVYHTFVNDKQFTREQVLAREKAKLRFLRRVLVETIAEGSKTFVVKPGLRPLEVESVLPLFCALNRVRSNSLLWVREAIREEERGLVEEILPGLFCGYIRSFAPPHRVPALSVPAWMEVITNAAIVLRGEPTEMPGQVVDEAFCSA